MKNIRYYIDLVENAMQVYHGGSYTGGDYNPDIIGEPRNHRPFGKGLYTAATVALAQRYVKYAGEAGKVTKFEVSPNAVIYPWGALSWRALSPAEQEKWRKKSNEIQQAFEQAGLVRYDTFEKKYQPWNYAVSNNPSDKIRTFLVSLGIDGARADLGEGMVEIVFYNTDVLKPVNES